MPSRAVLAWCFSVAAAAAAGCGAESLGGPSSAPAGKADKPGQLNQQQPNQQQPNQQQSATGNDCLFAERLRDLVAQPELTFGPTTVVTPGTPEAASLAQQLQFLAGMAARDWGMSRFADGVGQLDHQRLEITPLAAPDGRSFLLYGYGDGDELHGFVFEDAELPAALFCDDFLCTCAIEVGGRCLFEGEDVWDVLEHPTVRTVAEQHYDNGNFDSMPPIRQEQLRRGMEAQQRRSIATPREAFEMADYGPRDPYVSTTDLEFSNGLRFVYFNLSLGENGFGFIFADGQHPVATYLYSQLDNCRAPR